VVRKFRLPLILLFSSIAFLKLHGQEVSVKLIVPDSVLAGDNFEIAVHISKGTNTNFARVLLEMPPGFHVDSSDSDSGRYTEDGSKVKYIWDRMPTKNELLVKFKITTNPDFSGMKGVNGHFAYILNEEKQEIAIATKTIKIQQPESASVATEEPIPEIDAVEQSVPTEETNTTVVTSTIPVVMQEDDKQPPKVTETNLPIEFRIQMVASASKLNIDQLKAKYNVNESVRMEMHNGLWKYTIGSYSSYGSAKGKLPMYQNEKGVAGAFITAYQGGQRISVGSAIKQTK